MIKDVSKGWAMLMESEESEDQKYAKACDEACKEIKKIEEEEIDGYDAEEVDPCECGFAECEVQVDEVVDPLKMWQDLKKDTKPVEVRVDADYISKIQSMFGKFKSAKPKVYAQVMKKLDEYRKNGTKLPPPEDFIENFIPFDEIQRSGEDSYSDTDNVFGNKDAEENLWDSMNEEQQADIKKQVSDDFKSAKREVKTASRQEVKEFLKNSKGAIEDAQRKINDQQLNGNIAKITGFLEKYSNGRIQDNEGNQALGEKEKVGFWSPIEALAKGCLRFLVWMLRLTGLAVFGTGWLIKLLGKVSSDLCAKLDQSLAECQIMECDGEDDEVLDETGCAVKKECGDEDSKEEEIEEAVEDKAVTLKHAKQVFAQFLKDMCSVDDATKMKSLQGKIDSLKEIEANLEKEAKNPGKWNKFKYAIKSLIPFNSTWRWLVDGDKTAGIGMLACIGGAAVGRAIGGAAGAVAGAIKGNSEWKQDLPSGQFGGLSDEARVATQLNNIANKAGFEAIGQDKGSKIGAFLGPIAEISTRWAGYSSMIEGFLEQTKEARVYLEKCRDYLKDHPGAKIKEINTAVAECDSVKQLDDTLNEADYREAVSHLLDPVGVKASTASLKAQDTAALSIVEKLLTKIEKLEQRLEESESRAEKNSAEAASSKSAVNEAETINDIKTIDKWYAHLMKACCSVPEDPKLIEALLKIIKQVEKNLHDEYLKPGDWEKLTVLWKDHFCAEDLLNYFTQTSNQYGLVLLTQMNPAAFIDGKTDYRKAIKDFQNKTADCRKFLVDKAKNVQTITTKLSEDEDKWSKMSLEEQEDEELKGWGLNDDQIAVLDTVNKIEENPEVKRHLTPDEEKKFKFYRELSFKRELNDQEKKDFIELVKGVDSEEIFDIIDKMEGNSFFGKSELFNYKDSWEDRKRIKTLEKRITKLTDEVRMGKFNDDTDKEKEAMDKIKEFAEELKKLDPSNSMVKDIEKMDNSQKTPKKGQGTWEIEEWNSFLSSASKKQREDLMNELIDDIEKRYPDKNDKESQKKKSEEMMYVWKLFKHDATTREFGRAFNSSHAGAGKYINTTVDMWRDAIKLLCKQENLKFDSSTFKDILGDNRLFAKLKYILGELSRTRRRNKI